jgi:hypothetical protein
MNLINLCDFIQALNNNRKHPTKNEYFPKHILFTTIYLLPEQKLNHRNYSKKEINMENFVRATENDVDMYAKFGDLNFYGFFVINYSKI